ncbi:MAG: cyclic nucleotide-binding domain-containing protein [Motiliproteus sp.]|nr:cyclic nucleotide-binding domain-containing protein [Motiliproteus sp.]
MSNLNLSSYPLFHGIEATDLAVLSTYLKPVQFAEGRYLFLKGDHAHSLYLIQRGSVEVVNRLSDETQVPIAVRQEGDSIGEMALIDASIRTASVRTLDFVEAFELRQEDLNQIRKNNTDIYIQIILNIAREISHRLQEVDESLGGTVFCQPYK